MTGDAGQPALPAWVTLTTLTATFVVVANKARRAKGATDPLIHADVIVGVAALVVAVIKARRVLRQGPAAG